MSQIADAESEAGSICDEERVKKLFQACDGDGDGFIDRFVCSLFINSFLRFELLLNSEEKNFKKIYWPFLRYELNILLWWWFLISKIFMKLLRNVIVIITIFIVIFKSFFILKYFINEIKELLYFVCLKKKKKKTLFLLIFF